VSGTCGLSKCWPVLCLLPRVLWRPLWSVQSAVIMGHSIKATGVSSPGLFPTLCSDKKVAPCSLHEGLSTLVKHALKCQFSDGQSTEVKDLKPIRNDYESAALPTELRRRGSITLSLACTQMCPRHPRVSTFCLYDQNDLFERTRLRQCKPLPPLVHHRSFSTA
jgi:hypothetical protein